MREDYGESHQYAKVAPAWTRCVASRLCPGAAKHCYGYAGSHCLLTPARFMTANLTANMRALVATASIECADPRRRRCGAFTAHGWSCRPTSLPAPVTAVILAVGGCRCARAHAEEQMPGALYFWRGGAARTLLMDTSAGRARRAERRVNFQEFHGRVHERVGDSACSRRNGKIDR